MHARDFGINKRFKGWRERKKENYGFEGGENDAKNIFQRCLILFMGFSPSRERGNCQFVMKI